MSNENWIAVDWGTSQLRVWKMSAQGDILEHRRSEKGMNSLNSDQFESVLIALTQDWFNDHCITQILACGMLGSRQGWVEAGYLTTPSAPKGSYTQAPVSDARIKVAILPGIKQLSPADVMRGEETQIAGLLVNNKHFSGVVCLPGTHSKWANVVDGEVLAFQTFMTGELYSLLCKHSVLRHSLDHSAWDAAAFEAAVMESMQHPQSVTAKLFSLRAKSLVGELAGDTASSRLSGLLIGLEIANCQSYLTENPIHTNKVVIIGESVLSQHYSDALHLMSIATQQENSETMTLRGLTLAYQELLAV